MRDGREGEKAIRQKDKKMMCYYELVLSYSSRSIHEYVLLALALGIAVKGRSLALRHYQYSILNSVTKTHFTY